MDYRRWQVSIELEDGDTYFGETATVSLGHGLFLFFDVSLSRSRSILWFLALVCTGHSCAINSVETAPEICVPPHPLFFSFSFQDSKSLQSSILGNRLLWWLTEHYPFQVPGLLAWTFYSSSFSLCELTFLPHTYVFRF